MDVHYIWIGSKDIPNNYLINYKKCFKLNPQFSFNIWKNEDCLRLIEEHNLLEVFTPLSFICKCNILKYLVLHKFGGIYTDFDIIWNRPFISIMNDFNFSNVDLILTTTNGNTLIDDPFIVSKPNILGNCISYCQNRTNLRYDGELYDKTREIKIHNLEPFGPFGLTEWIQRNNVNYHSFPQEILLDNNGFLGKHQQKSNWKLD